MPNCRFRTSNLELHVPTYLSLHDAARKFDQPEEVLTQLIQAGKIEAVQLPSVELLVNATNCHYKTKKEIIAEEFTHLCKQTISASEASRKYSKVHGIPIPQPNFSYWAKAGYIEVKSRGYRLQLNEADVAYCTKIYAEKYKEYGGRLQGVHIFDEHGNPYQLKYREVAKKMRSERRQRKKKAETVK